MCLTVMSGFASSKASISWSIALTRPSKKYCQYSISTADAGAAVSAAARPAAAVVSLSLWALPHFVWSNGSILARNNSGPARPYMARLRVFRRLI